MPSPIFETRTLDDLSALLLELGVVRRSGDLAGAERLVGWESVVVRTVDGWIYRFGRKGEAAFLRELAVLALVEGRLGVPTPRVEVVDHPQQLMGYRTISGASLDLPRVLSRAPAERVPLVRSLAQVLASMHALAGTARERVQVPFLDPAAMVAELRNLRPDLSVADATVLDSALAAWDRTALSKTAGDPVLLHGDFHPGNMVFDGPSGPLSGIWDFSCVELGDPTADLRYLSGDSERLAREVAAAYTDLTGRELDVSGARLMLLLEDATDALAEGRPVAEVLELLRRSADAS